MIWNYSHLWDKPDVIGRAMCMWDMRRWSRQERGTDCALVNHRTAMIGCPGVTPSTTFSFRTTKVPSTRT
jgi:hypothetical protein